MIYTGTSRRVVLIVDMWHPELSDEQQLKVLQSSKAFVGKTQESLPTYISIKQRFQTTEHGEPSSILAGWLARWGTGFGF